MGSMESATCGTISDLRNKRGRSSYETEPKPPHHNSAPANRTKSMVVYGMARCPPGFRSSCPHVVTPTSANNQKCKLLKRLLHVLMVVAFATVLPKSSRSESRC